MKPVRRGLASPEFQDRRAVNESLQCDVRGCGSLRFSIAKHCRKHEGRYLYWGSPTGEAVRMSHFKHERDEVAALFDDPANAKHPGLMKVVAYVQSLLDEAERTEGRGFKGAEELQRLRKGGTTALDIVTAGVALQLYLRRTGKGGALRYEQFLTARAVFGLQPRERRYSHVYPFRQRAITETYAKRIRPSALAHIGALLVEALAKVAANAATSIETREERRAARRVAELAALEVPFVAVDEYQ